MIRKQLLELGYKDGINKVKQMRDEYKTFIQIQAVVSPNEKESKAIIAKLFNAKCKDTMRTLMRWYNRGFERGASDYIWENR